MTFRTRILIWTIITMVLQLVAYIFIGYTLTKINQPIQSADFAKVMVASATIHIIEFYRWVSPV